MAKTNKVEKKIFQVIDGHKELGCGACNAMTTKEADYCWHCGVAQKNPKKDKAEDDDPFGGGDDK